MAISRRPKSEEEARDSMGTRKGVEVMKRFVSILLALMLFIAVMPTAAFADSTKTVYVSSTGSGTLNLREGPGYEYAVKGYVKHNYKVTVKATSGVWSQVKVKKTGKTGWIRTMYIDGTTKALGNGYKAIIAGTKVYKKADSSSSVLGTITTADTVRVTYTEHDFAKVKVTDSGLTGWIPISCIGGTVKLIPDAPPSSSSTVYRTTASTLNMRSGPGTSYKVIAKLKKGTGCTILKSSGNWRKVKTLKGKIGWVSRTYLTANATAKVTASALNVRKGPGTSSAILGSLKRGTKVTVKYTSGNWAYVSTSKLTGYVSLNYLKF